MAAIHKPKLPTSTIPDDDPSRTLAIIDPDDPALRHVALVGDTYTILLSGEQTAGKYCLIDMSIPRCGGPGPHRHDFEEMFHILEGEVEFTFRGETHVARAGMTVNIPANAPHFFTNQQGAKLRMLCMCTPACQEDFFLAVGTPVERRDSPAPAQTDEQKAEFIQKAGALAAKYRTEMIKP